MAVVPGSTSHLDENIFQTECETAFGSFDEMDVSSLLNEELEKSRNTLFLVTFFTILVTLVDIKEFAFLGIKASINPNVGMVMLLFLFAATFLLGIYYLINAKADRIAKLSKHSIIKIKTHNFEKYLELVCKDADVKLLPESKSTAHEQAMARSFKSIGEVQRSRVVKFSTDLDKQEQVLQFLPFGMVMTCVIAEAVAIYFEVFVI